MGKIGVMSITWNQPTKAQRRSFAWGIPDGAWEVLAILACVLLLGSGWRLSAGRVPVTVDGVTYLAHTHRAQVRNLLMDLGLTLRPQDQIHPGPTAALGQIPEVSVILARPVRFQADGQDRLRYVAGERVDQVVANADISLDAYDQVILNGQPVSRLDLLPVPPPPSAAYAFAYPWNAPHQNPPVIQVKRAIPILVDDGGLPFTIQTTAPTVGEALREADMILYLGDHIQPSLGSPISTGLRVLIQRSNPLHLFADGREMKTRVQGRTVGDALSEMGIGVAGLDQVQPGLGQLLYDNIEIRVTRVQEDVEVEEDIVPFDTVFVPDSGILIDNQEVQDAGAEGITRSRFRVRYEDGAEVAREFEDRWVAQTPAQRKIAFGQRITPRTVTGPDGQELTYWRRIRMFATSYSAATAGVSPDKPWYGLTRTGERMRFGVIAVDPRIVPLGSELFVPGYGRGQALDTGNAIRARSIDLGYDDNNLRLWRQWVDVYLLWPPPPSYQITWVLPNWPPLPQ